MKNPEVVGRVAGLFIYPIKGCKAIELNSALASPRGFPYDRHWVIVKEATHRYITQRNFPKLTKIVPELPADVLDGTGTLTDKHLTIRLPATPNVAEFLRVPLTRADPVLKQITVREWSGAAMDEGDEAAQRLSAYLNEAVRLFRFISDDTLREQLPKEKVTRPVSSTYVYGHETTFSDGFPYLIVNQKSYAELKAEVLAVSESSRSFPMDRFRPNIVIEAHNAWEEDQWREIQIRSLRLIDESVINATGPTFKLVKPCQRCSVTCIDQSTALPGIEPLDTLKRLHNGRTTGFEKHLMKTENEGFFGWNSVTSDSKPVFQGDAVCAVKLGTWVAGLSWGEYAQMSMDWFLGR